MKIVMVGAEEHVTMLMTEFDKLMAEQYKKGERHAYECMSFGV